MHLKSYSLLLFLLLSCCTKIHGQHCYVGHNDTTGFNSSNTISSNTLMGVKFELNTAGILKSINLWGNPTGAQVQMVVYNDLDGIPNTLMATSAIDTVTHGIVSLPVVQTLLHPGTYWVMAAYSTTGNHTFRKASNTPVYYSPFAPGASPPSNGQSFQATTGNDYAYFLEVDCSMSDAINDTTAIEYNLVLPDFDLTDICFPEVGEAEEEVVIYNNRGIRIKTTSISAANNTINIDDLPHGTYLVTVNRVLRRMITK